MRFTSIALTSGAMFGVLWGLLIWYLLWHSKGWLFTASAATLAGVVYGLLMASCYRYSAAKLGLPAWDRIPGQSFPQSRSEDRAIAAWLQSHDSGWRPTLVDSAPGKRVRGAGFDLNSQTNQCVLNDRVDEKGHRSQVVRPIKPDDPISQVWARAE